MDLIDGQAAGCVRISFGYMSTLEDAQAFLRFIIATQLHPSHGQPLPLATPGEGWSPARRQRGSEQRAATWVRGSPSPQEDASPHSGVWNNSPTAFNAEDLCPPLLGGHRTPADHFRRTLLTSQMGTSGHTLSPTFTSTQSSPVRHLR